MYERRAAEALPGIEPANPVEAARTAIWRLFQEGYVDEDMATAGLLAVDLGTRRAARHALRAVEPCPPAPSPCRRETRE